MADCPTPEELEDLVRGRLDPSRFGRVAPHADACPACRDRIRVLQSSFTQVWIPAGEDPSASTVDFHPSASGGPVAAAPVAAGVPEALLAHPRYVELEPLGSGGMGSVYKARHKLLDRPVVVKVIRRDLVGSLELVERFRREARLAARLDHPNIVAVYEAEQVGELHLLVMEYLDGPDLSALVRARGPLPAAEACAIIAQAARGLQHAHERGMVHRDVKPSNLMLTRAGRVKVLDLGLAKLRAEAEGDSISGDLTAARQMLGSIDFASPEQWESSAEVDIRADIYSLGCTLYYLLAGSAPFPRERYSSVLKQMWAHAQEPPPPIRTVRPDLPEPLVAVLERMLAKDPSGRYASPARVAEALEPMAEDADLVALASGMPIAPPHPGHGRASTLLDPRGTGSRPSSPSVLGRARRRRRLRRRLGGAVLALAAVGFGIILSRFGWSGHQPDPATPPPPVPTPVTAVPTFEGPPIKVGVLHSRTGTMALSERPVVDATLLAIDELNAAGGVLGRKVEPVLRDGQSDPEVFARMAAELIDREGVAALFGCWTSASRKQVVPEVERRGGVMFYPVQFEGLERSPNVVYLGQVPSQQLVPAVSWSVAFLRKKRVFLLGSDYIYPRAAAAILESEIRSAGGEVVGTEFIPLGQSDLDPVVARIKASGADLLINLVNGDSNVALFRDLREAGLTSDLMPTLSTSISEEELGSLSPSAVAGDYLAWSYFQGIDRPENRRFVERFRARFGPQRAVTDPMQAAYVGVHLWAEAAKAAGSVEPSAVLGSIGGLTFEAPEGPIRIDPGTRHAWRIARIAKVAPDGTAHVVYSSGEPVEPVPFPADRSREDWDRMLADLQAGWGGRWSAPAR